MSTTYTIGQEVVSRQHGAGTVTHVSINSLGVVKLDIMFGHGEEEGIYADDLNDAPVVAGEIPARTLNELIALITDGLSRNGHDFTHREAREVIAAVELEGDDFAKDVAKTVARFGKSSSKQAYIIAKAYLNI